MKLLAVATALTALAAIAAATPDAGPAALKLRQGGGQSSLAGGFGMLARDDKAPDDKAPNDGVGGVADPGQTDANEKPSPSPPASPSKVSNSSSPPPAKPTPSQASPPPSSPSPKPTDSASAATSATTKSTKSTPQPPPSPTGAPCSSNGQKRCAESGAGYQQCQGGVWVSQSCDGANVCGKDDKGNVVCMSPDQATVTRESCSHKGEQRCDATDKTKYQTCDGSHWQTFTCDQANTCQMNGDKVACAGLATGSNGAISYTLHEPLPYEPLSGASSLKAAAFGTLLATALALALALSSAGL
ncbi:hypothetical protein LPJ61_006941 [Coemansia biformis]|uniref:Uncharacterized protein n=1 Tax=Coemansia biformis TaxID=1286918 RepID=A0A9W7XP49_9FUNG|nr:hypothetical protein LPJ61_006941 [Coemansia biformis]